MKKNQDITKPRYSEQILPVLWALVISRFHCMYNELGLDVLETPYVFPALSLA